METAFAEVPITAPISDAPANASGMNLAQAMHAHISEQKAAESGQAPVQQEAPPEQKPAPKAEQHPKTEEKPSDTPETAKKGPWEKLGKKEEAKTEETSPEAEEYPDDAPKAQNAWTKIKQENKEFKAKLAEWESVKAKQWEQEKAAWENEKKALSEKSAKWDDQKESDYQKMRDRYALDYIKETDEYRNEAQSPWDQGNSSIKDISEYTKLDPKDFKDALMEPNRLARKKALTELIKKSDVELADTEIISLADEAFRAGEQIQKAVDAHERLTKDASLKREQALNQEKASSMKAQEEAKQVRTQALNEVLSGMKAQIKDIIEAGILDESDVDGAGEGFDMEQDPMDLAFGNAAANLAPKLFSKIRELQGKLDKYEAERKERNGTKPTLKPTGTTVPRGTNGAPRQSLDDAMRAYRANGYK